MRNLKVCIIIILFCLVLPVVFSENNKGTTWEEVCDENTCQRVMYSYIKNVYEDNQWKDVKEAKSLKNYFNVVYLNNSENLTVLDFNDTAITIIANDDKYKNKDLRFRLSDKHNKTKVKKDKTIGKLKKGENITVDISDLENASLIFNRAIFGSNSTEIIFDNWGVELTDDTYVNNNYPDSVLGDFENMYQNKIGYEAYMRYNLTLLPSGIIVNSAKLQLRTTSQSGTQTGVIIECTNKTGWSEETLTWNTRVGLYNSCGGDILDYLDVTDPLLNNYTVTVAVQNATDDNNILVLKLAGGGSIHTQGYATKEHATTSYRPVLYVTYTPQRPNVTTPTITPSGIVYSNNFLNCTTIPTDNENTSIIVQYHWYNNSNLVDIYSSNTTCTNGTLCGASTLYSTPHHFDNVTCEVSSYDGTYWSYLAINSTPKYINNSIPTIDGATINNTSPIDTDDLACNNGTITDIDWSRGDDSLTLYYDWNINSAWQGINSYNLSSSFTTTDDIVYCKILVGDGYVNSSAVTSSTVVIASSLKSPTINYTNATSGITGIDSSVLYPINNNTYINMSVAFNDSNSNEKWTVFFCNTNSFSGNNCSGITYCSTPANQTLTTQSCRYNISGIGESLFNYYAFVLDNSSLFSAGKLKTAYINHYPENLTHTTANNTYFKTNYANLQFTATDRDGDSINYSLYNSTNMQNFTLLYNGTSSSYNFSNLADGVYYWLFSAKDEHNYETPLNTTTVRFTIDTKVPNSTISSPSQGATYSSLTVPLVTTASDINLDTCYYKILYTATNGLHTANTNFTCNSSVNMVLTAYSDFTVYYYVNDSANNIKTRSINFTTSSPSVIVSGGGGGAPPGTGKLDCNYNITPVEMVFSPKDKVKLLILDNKENFSITPSYNIDSENFEVRTTSSILLANSKLENTVLKNYQGNETTRAILTVSSAECKDKTIEIVFSPKGKEPTLLEFLAQIEYFIKEKVLGDVILFGYPIKFYWFLLLLAVIISAILIPSRAKTVNKVTAGLFLFIFIGIMLSFIVKPGVNIVNEPTYTGKGLNIMTKEITSVSNFDVYIWMFFLAFLVVLLGFSWFLKGIHWYIKLPISILISSVVTYFIYLYL